MRPVFSIVALACVLLASTPCVALDNGLGIRPAMGFNTWNAFNVDSALNSADRPHNTRRTAS